MRREGQTFTVQTFKQKVKHLQSKHSNKRSIIQTDRCVVTDLSISVRRSLNNKMLIYSFKTRNQAGKSEVRKHGEVIYES